MLRSTKLKVIVDFRIRASYFTLLSDVVCYANSNVFLCVNMAISLTTAVAAVLLAVKSAAESQE